MLAGLFQKKGPSKDHWVSDAKATHCAARGCGKLFDAKIRRHHCRRCGLVFCDEHSAHRMRLNAQAEPDEEGEMSRVCESCFMKEQQPATPVAPKANTSLVVHVAGEVTSRSRFDLFLARRTENNKKMTEMSAPVADAYVKVRALQSRSDRKQVVAWTPDSQTARCKECLRGFTTVVRKHHCRLCGGGVCGREECSFKRKSSIQLSANAIGKLPVGVTATTKEDEGFSVAVDGT